VLTFSLNMGLVVLSSWQVSKDPRFIDLRGKFVALYIIAISYRVLVSKEIETRKFSDIIPTLGFCQWKDHRLGPRNGE
jgi:hypothetical protein